MRGAVGHDLGFHVFGLESAFASIAVPEFDRLSPLGSAKARLDRIPHQLFRRDLFVGGCFLNLSKQLAGKAYALGRHTSIVLLFRKGAQLLRLSTLPAQPD
jgi:hypothetical protein